MKRKVCAILLTLGVVICQLSPSAMTVTEVRTGKSAAEMITEATAEEIVADNAADKLTVEAAEETAADNAADKLTVEAAEETAADNAADELTVEAAEDEPTIEESSETHSEQTPENEVIAETADNPQETDSSSSTDLNREETETSSIPQEDLVGEEAKDCSIYFSPDDASVGEMPDITVKAGTEYVLPECAYTCEGATFYMWNTSLGNKQAGDTIIVEEDVYVYPLWAEVVDRDSSPQDLSMTQVMGKLILTDKATGEVYTYTIDPGNLLNLSSSTYITKSTFDEPSNEIVEEYIETIKNTLKFFAERYLDEIDYTGFYHLDAETLTVSDPEIIESKVYTENDTSYSKYFEDNFYTKTPIYPGDCYKLWQYTVTLEGEYSSSYPITVHWSSVDGEDLMEPLVFNLKTGTSFRDFEEQTSFFVRDGYVYSDHLLIWPLRASDYSSYSDYEYYYSSTLSYHDIATGASEREYVTKPLDLYCIMLKEVPAVELTVEPPASEAEIRRIQEYKKYNIDSLSGVSAPNITVDTSECYAYINYYNKNDSGNDFGRWEREDSEQFAGKNIDEQDLLFYTGISPKPGYIFTEDVQVTVNGATVQSMDLGTLWIEIFGSIAVQDSVKEDANACAVSFTSGHSDSSGEMPTVTVKEGTDYTLPKCAFTRENSSFYCWKVNGEEKQVGDTITVNQDTLLTAVWYYDVERDENPRDLSTTQVIAQLNLRDTKTGEVYTRTIDSCNEDDLNSYHYYYIDFIINSTFDDPSNPEVEKNISQFKSILQEYWVEFFDTSLLPSGRTLLLKNLDVSLPEVLETKEYEETSYSYEPAEGSDDYMRSTFIPGDHYNKWRYTITLDAEYSDCASVTVHWSSVDGEDMREPFVITAALNTQLSTLEDQIPAFDKDGYVNSNYYTLESYSEAATHDPVDWELDSSHDDFEETHLENDIDVYCIMRKILPEAEITVSVAPCGSGNYLDYDETFYKNAWITIETYECVYHMPELLKKYESNKKYGIWIDAAGETFYGDFIGGQEYLFTVSLNANTGYAFSEDTKIIINNGTFKSMTINSDGSVDVCGSVTIEHSPSEAVEENIVEPTDTENGSFDLVIRCNGCGEIISSQSFVINAPGDDWKEWNKAKADTDAEEYTIFFGAAGSHAEGEMPSVTVKAGTEYVMPACAFTCDDADFYMWHTNKGNKHVGDTITVNENIYVCPLWAGIADKDHTAQDLSMTRIVGQITLTDKATGEVKTKTFDPGTLLNPTYNNAAGIIKSTFDEPSNASVEKYIKLLKDELRETAEDISGYDNYNFKENGLELDIKKSEVSDPEIIESKTSAEKDASPQKQSMSSEYLRDLIYPEDYYNIWQYTVTLEAEYYSFFPVTVHWSSVDGEDLMDPVVFNIKPGECLPNLFEQDPLFVKEGYTASGIVKGVPFSEYEGDVLEFKLDIDHYMLSAYWEIYKPTDVYYIMLKTIPEIELTINSTISEKDLQQIRAFIQDDCDTGLYVTHPAITTETLGCTDSIYPDECSYPCGLQANWETPDPEHFTVEIIDEQDLTLSVNFFTILGYCISEDASITVNGGTFHSMSKYSDIGYDELTIYCSMTAKIDNDPAPPEAESTPTPKPSYTEHDGEHSWDEGVITLEPTWMETGVKTYTCSICGETKTEEVPALKDSWDEWNKSMDDKEPEVTYRNTGGGGEYFTKGDGKSLTFTFKGPVDDRETLSHFKGIRVDGSDISVANYIAETGRVAITLKINYLETLDAGWHTLTAVFDDGDDVKVSFKVEEGEKSAEEDDSSATEGDNTDSKDSSGESQNTPTGLPTIPITGIPENTEDAPTGLPTIPITGIPENTEKTPTTVPTGTVTTVPENAQEVPTGLPTIPITGIPENTEKSQTSTPARTVANTSSGTQKAPARTYSSRTTSTTNNTSGSAQKTPTRTATRAAATGDNNQAGVWVLLFVAALATLSYRRPGRKNN